MMQVGRWGEGKASMSAATTSRISVGWLISGSIRRPMKPISPTGTGTRGRGHRRRHRQDETLLGRVWQQTRRCRSWQGRSGAPPAQQFRNPVHCVDLIERRSRLCSVTARTIGFRCSKTDGTFVKEAFSRKARLGAGSVWDIAFSRVPQQRYMFIADGQNVKVRIVRRETLEETDEFRRRRPSARPVLRRAQHRDRFAGQSLHDRNLRRQARAEVRLQRHRHGRGREPGCTVAEISQEHVGFRDLCRSKNALASQN